jgi:hypothetical protein
LWGAAVQLATCRPSQGTPSTTAPTYLIRVSGSKYTDWPHRLSAGRCYPQESRLHCGPLPCGRMVSPLYSLRGLRLTRLPSLTVPSAKSQKLRPGLAARPASPVLYSNLLSGSNLVSPVYWLQRANLIHLFFPTVPSARRRKLCLASAARAASTAV